MEPVVRPKRHTTITDWKPHPTDANRAILDISIHECEGADAAGGYRKGKHHSDIKLSVPMADLVEPGRIRLKTAIEQALRDLHHQEQAAGVKGMEYRF